LVGLRVSPAGTVTVAPFGIRERARVLAVRSSVDRRWALLVASVATRADVRRAFLLERVLGRWRVRMSAARGEVAEEVCRRPAPGIAVVIDLGLSTAPPDRCRHPRSRAHLVRSMSAAELASVRAMVEWRQDQDTFEMVPGPTQPEAHEVFASNCSWDGRGEMVPPPSGEVSRADPRWGTVTIFCVYGSDGFALLETSTVILVGRAGQTGAFTRAVAHTMPTWSMIGELCHEDRRWAVPAAARVGLEFCTPFPAALRGVLR
jgi:hypothetical protein